MPPSPNTFPTEIWEAICGHLCGHCRGLSGADTGDDYDDEVQALASLSATSKKMQSVAQPVLFHRLLRGFGKPNNLRHFIQCLENRPELTYHIRQVDITVHPWKYHCEDDVPFFKEAATRLFLAKSLDDPVLKRADTDPEIARILRAEVLLSLIPEVEDLEVDPETIWGKAPVWGGELDFTTFLMDRQDATNGVYERLTTLRISSDPEKLFSTCHPIIPVLLNWVPDLEKLTISDAVGWDSDCEPEAMVPELPMLSSLEITHSVLISEFTCEGHLQGIIEQLPNLKRFTYWGTETRCCEVALDVVRSLSSVSHCLEYLDIDSNMIRIDPPDHDEVHLAPMLHRFPELKTLKIDEASFCRHWLLPMFQVTKTVIKHSACAIEILAPPVETLVIRVAKRSKLWRDMVKLGKYVLRGEFPNLRRLTLLVAQRLPAYRYELDSDGEDEDISDEMAALQMEDIRECVLDAFEGSNVEVTVEPDPRH